MTSKSKLSVVIDIGTSKLVAIAGTKNEAGKLEISAVAKTIAKGIRRGVICDIEEVAVSVKELLDILESKINERIEKVHVAYAGQHMKTVHFQRVKFTSKDGIVTKSDIDGLNEEAKNAEIEEEYKLIEVILVSFVIDREINENPVGSTGRKIEANYKLLIMPNIYWDNLHLVFEKLNVKLGKITLSTLAIAEAVLTPDEKEMGVIVLDIGSGTTKLAIFHENKLIHTAVIPFGGDVITSDIKESCSIMLKWAEQLKIQYGQALGDFADDQKVVSIPGHNDWEPKEISFKSLAFIIQARIEEIVDGVNFQIEKSGIADQVSAGIVLTGGTSNLENIVSLVKFGTGLDVKKGNLILALQEGHKEIQSNDYFTALGLLSLVENKTITDKPKKGKPVKSKKSNEPGKLSPWFSKVVQGVLDLIDDDNEDVPMNNSTKTSSIDEELIIPEKKDEVFCGSCAPESVTPEEEFVVRFTAYTSRFRNVVRNIINQEAPTAKQSFDLTSSQWIRGTNVAVSLHAQHLEIQNPIQKFEWNGKYHILRYDVKVKKGITANNIILKIDVIVENLPILFIRPEITLIQSKNLSSMDTSLKYSENRSPETAFASYAKSDRQTVLGRVRSIQIATGIDIFLDCLSIKPSEEWKSRLEEEIKLRDIFWLFWSRNAKQSEWVEWEWRTALKHKTLAQIQPHPLESAESAPPPEELSELQFGSLFELYLSAINKSNEKSK